MSKRLINVPLYIYLTGDRFHITANHGSPHAVSIASLPFTEKVGSWTGRAVERMEEFIII